MGFISQLFGGKSKSEKQQDANFNSAFLPIVQQGAQQSQSYYNMAAPTLTAAREGLKAPQDYFSKILSGGQGMMDALSPELSDESTAYKNISASSQFAPRGAGQVSRQGQLDTQHLKSISDIVQRARPNAANQLTGIAQILAQLGLGEASASTGSAGTIGALLNQYRQGNFQEYQAHQQAISSMMGSIGGIIGMFA
jgi:hypothetical protein